MKTRKHLHPEICAIRADRLTEFRLRGYKFLADAIRATSGSAAELELIDGTTDDGQEYQIEVTAFWDDKPGRAIRVSAEALQVPLRPLLGFIPIYVGGPCEEFIMLPDGRCLGEEGTAP